MSTPIARGFELYRLSITRDLVQGRIYAPVADLQRSFDEVRASDRPARLGPQTIRDAYTTWAAQNAVRPWKRPRAKVFQPDFGPSLARLHVLLRTSRGRASSVPPRATPLDSGGHWAGWDSLSINDPSRSIRPMKRTFARRFNMFTKLAVRRVSGRSLALLPLRACCSPATRQWPRITMSRFAIHVSAKGLDLSQPAECADLLHTH